MKFGEQLTVDEFKERNNAKELKLIRNPETGKLFMLVNGKTVGAVSEKYDKEHPFKQVVELIIEEDGKEKNLWCLTNDTNVEEIL